MVEFIAIIHKDAESDYGVCFPDFPGCISAGSTMEDARLKAHEALQDHIDIALEYGDTIPRTGVSLDDAYGSEFAKDAVAFISVNAIVPGTSKRVNITLDSGLLDEIDRTHKNRSAFLAKAAESFLYKHDHQGCNQGNTRQASVMTTHKSSTAKSSSVTSGKNTTYSKKSTKKLSH